VEKKILDACCGSRMFWFDRQNKAVVFVDKRKEAHELKDASSAGGHRTLIIDPDIQADFTKLPLKMQRLPWLFSIRLIWLEAVKRGGWQRNMGNWKGDWRQELRMGFSECFRVLRDEGTLIFKWNEFEVPVSDILKLTQKSPYSGIVVEKLPGLTGLFYEERPTTD